MRVPQAREQTFKEDVFPRVMNEIFEKISQGDTVAVANLVYTLEDVIIPASTKEADKLASQLNRAEVTLMKEVYSQYRERVKDLNPKIHHKEIERQRELLNNAIESIRFAFARLHLRIIAIYFRRVGILPKISAVDNLENAIQDVALRLSGDLEMVGYSLPVEHILEVLKDASK